MASTAWTAPRAELIQALDVATREREMWRMRAEATAMHRATLRGEAAIRKANERQRRREREVLARDTDQGRLEQTFAETPTDPNADLHRRILVAALKEKP